MPRDEGACCVWTVWTCRRAPGVPVPLSSGQGRVQVPCAGTVAGPARRDECLAQAPGAAARTRERVAGGCVLAWWGCCLVGGCLWFQLRVLERACVSHWRSPLELEPSPRFWPAGHAAPLRG